MPRMDRRRRHDFKKFREQLEQLSSAEIRERLNSNRIRSTQRRALAEEVLRERAQVHRGPGASAAARASRAAQDAGEAAKAASGRSAGRHRLGGRGRGAAGRDDMATLRQLGCVLGVLVVLGGMTVLLAGLLRR